MLYIDVWLFAVYWSSCVVFGVRCLLCVVVCYLSSLVCRVLLAVFVSFPPLFCFLCVCAVCVCAGGCCWLLVVFVRVNCWLLVYVVCSFLGLSIVVWRLLFADFGCGLSCVCCVLVVRGSSCVVNCLWLSVGSCLLRVDCCCFVG